LISEWPRALSRQTKQCELLSHPQITVNGTPFKNVYKEGMKAAFMNGLLGLIGSFSVGLYLLGMSNFDIIVCIAASMIAALLSLISTLKAVKSFPSSKKPNARLVRAWCVLVFIYLAILFLLAPPLRNTQTFLYLIFPLILTSGFSILVFGPIQDYVVSAEQKKRR
jgi:hypothetical protein